MKILGPTTLVAGVILMTAGSTWFTGAFTVGLILVIASSLVIALSIAIIALVAWVAVSDGDSLYARRRVPPSPRRRIS